MQTINTTCSECKARVGLSPESVTVNENLIDPDESRYSFTCPECGEAVTKPAPDEVLRILRGAPGIRWNFVRMPAEMREARPGGPALTLDDVHDFIIDMNRTPDHLIPILAGSKP